VARGDESRRLSQAFGDHATNIAENVYYLVHGFPLDAIRPKADKSSLEVMEPKRPAKSALR
jgi:phosphate transport system protein